MAIWWACIEFVLLLDAVQTFDHLQQFQWIYWWFLLFRCMTYDDWIFVNGCSLRQWYMNPHRSYSIRRASAFSTRQSCLNSIKQFACTTPFITSVSKGSSRNSEQNWKVSIWKLSCWFDSADVLPVPLAEYARTWPVNIYERRICGS